MKSQIIKEQFSSSWPSYLGTVLQLLNVFPFLSRLHAPFPWISCHCVIGAYIEAIISIRYLTACLLYKFHSNAGAWVFSKSFAVNGLISYPLLYLVLSVYFLP